MGAGLIFNAQALEVWMVYNCQNVFPIMPLIVDIMRMKGENIFQEDGKGRAACRIAHGDIDVFFWKLMQQGHEQIFIGQDDDR